ncbi:MAG: hypothetical protein Q9211_002564 [Gyalolechia sp. 1 TL-2023]
MGAEIDSSQITEEISGVVGCQLLEVGISLCRAPEPRYQLEQVVSYPESGSLVQEGQLVGSSTSYNTQVPSLCRPWQVREARLLWTRQSNLQSKLERERGRALVVETQTVYIDFGKKLEKFQGNVIQGGNGQSDDKGSTIDTLNQSTKTVSRQVDDKEKDILSQAKQELDEKVVEPQSFRAAATTSSAEAM